MSRPSSSYTRGSPAPSGHSDGSTSSVSSSSSSRTRASRHSPEAHNRYLPDPAEGLHTNALHLTGMDAAFTLSMRQPEIKYDCITHEASSEVPRVYPSFAPYERPNLAIKPDRCVTYLGPNVQLTIPRTNFNLNGIFVPLYGDGVKYDHSTPPPAPSRRARCRDLPDVSPTEPWPCATLLPESGFTQDRRSSLAPSFSSTEGDYNDARKKMNKKTTSRPRPQPANFDKFTFWLNSVLQDLYPPSYVEPIRQALLQMPLKLNEMEKEYVRSLLPYGMDKEFIHRRDHGKGKSRSPSHSRS